MKKLVSKNEYSKLFLQAVEAALKLCEAEHEINLSRNTKFRVSLPLYKDIEFDLNQILDILFIGEENFYKSIDVFVKKTTFDFTIILLLVSGHDPSFFHETWNPEYLGPFKPSVLEEIEH